MVAAVAGGGGCRAAVATLPATTEQRDLPLPPVGPEDGPLRVEAAGICGTDREIYLRSSRGRGLGPLILGHENVGEVVAVGDTVVVIGPGQQGLGCVVAARTGGAGSVIVIGTVRDAVAMAAKQGSLLLAASKHGKPVGDFAYDTVVRKELRLLGVRGHDQRSVVPAIEQIGSNRFPLRRLCTHAFGLDQVDQALQDAGARVDREAIHVSVIP